MYTEIQMLQIHNICVNWYSNERVQQLVLNFTILFLAHKSNVKFFVSWK